MRSAPKMASIIGAAALVAAIVPQALASGHLSTASGRTAGGSQTAAHSQAGRHGPRLDHIFVIMLENHSKSSVIDDPNAPYITSLAHEYSMADNYYGVTHPSMPNYIASIAGDNFGIQDDNSQNIVNFDRPNLADQLAAHGVSWAGYMEDLPADKLAETGPGDVPLYAKKHDPFVLFDSIKNDPAQLANVKDYSQMAGDLNSANPPQFVWITPNQCHDMHGGVYVEVPGHPETPCPYGDTKDDPNDAALKQKADDFVQGAVNTITSSNAWDKKSIIVIVTDENDYTGDEQTGGWESADGCCDSPYVEAGDARVSPDWPGGTYGGGLIPAIVVTGSGQHHYVDHTPYNHYSLLTTIEQNWKLPYLGHAGDTAHGVVPLWPLINAK